MQYLCAAEYVAFGLGVDTADDVVTAASAMIDTYCRRPSLGVAQYVEYIFSQGCRTAQMSYTPLVALPNAVSALVSVRTRARRGRFDVWHPLAEAAGVFATSAWTPVDIMTIDVTEYGLLTFQANLLGLSFDEVEVTYTAGYADVPWQVKVACAQIVRNAEMTPALNIKRQAVDGLQMEYFSGTLLDADVRRLLTPYVSERVG